MASSETTESSYKVSEFKKHSDEKPTSEIAQFIQDQQDAINIILRQLNSTSSEIIGIGNEHSPNLIFSFKPYRESLLKAAKRAIKGRYITDITPSNVKACKFIIDDLHVRMRHLQGNKMNILVTDDEFSSDISPSNPNAQTTKILYSNSTELIAQQKQLFETLWNSSIPAEQRIEEIEQGVELETTKLLAGSLEVRETTMRIVQSAKKEILLLVPTLSRLEIGDEIFQKLAEKVSNEKIHLRALSPFGQNLTSNQTTLKKFSMFQIRRIEPIKLGLMIADRSRMIFVQYHEVESKDPSEAIVSGIFSTHRETISSIVSIFETMWADSEMREKEAKSRKQAELLQDILTHDIRNYNQVARLSAELLKEELKDNVPVQSIVESMLQAVDGSTHLLERAKKLGKVISEEHPLLYPINLREVIRSAFSLVKMSFHDKAITLVEEYPRGMHSCFVLADDLLSEVFTNVFSNSVRYTESSEVEIMVEVFEPPEDLELVTNRASWIVSISDKGRGVPDEIKPKLFSRYLESAKGSGLGLSIVHALVVERYKGEIKVLNRVPEDYTQGTMFEIRLPKV